MQYNIIWSGREYQSLENCVARFGSNTTLVHSAIVGSYNETMYRLSYWLEADKTGCTRTLELHFQGNNKIRRDKLESDGRGNWMHNGRAAVQFQGCLDVDIPLTPFTNTLPIRRLHLNAAGSKEISVVYCDLLNDCFNPVKQRYVCLSPSLYHYENVPNDFEADISVDDVGLVIDYPQLFLRAGIVISNYPDELTTEN